MRVDLRLEAGDGDGVIGIDGGDALRLGGGGRLGLGLGGEASTLPVTPPKRLSFLYRSDLPMRPLSLLVLLGCLVTAAGCGQASSARSAAENIATDEFISNIDDAAAEANAVREAAAGAELNRLDDDEANRVDGQSSTIEGSGSVRKWR